MDDEGRVLFNIEVEFDIRLSQRLMLQPRFETDIAFQDAPITILVPVFKGSNWVRVCATKSAANSLRMWA